MSADFDRLRECVRDSAASRTGYAHSEDVLALGRVEERERALTEALRRIANSLGNVTELTPVEIHHVALAALAGSVAAGSGEE